MDTKVVEAGVKTDIVDEGLHVLYDPLFYNKQQAFDILQQLKTEIVNDNLEFSSFTPDVLSLTSSERQVAYRDERAVSTVYKQTMDNELWRIVLTKIRDDIEMANGIRCTHCVAEWHKDGHDRKVVTKWHEDDIDRRSSIIWISFGASQDLSLTSSDQPGTFSTWEKPKFSIYKFKLPSGSLLEMKPPINSYWSHELLASGNTEKSLHILLKFSLNVEEKSFDDDLTNCFIKSYSSNDPSSSVSECSTISPETEKVIRRQPKPDWYCDNLSKVTSSPQCTLKTKCTPKTSKQTEIKRQMSLDRFQSGPVQIQSSPTSSRSFSQVEHGFSIREQLSHKSHLYTKGAERSSHATNDSMDAAFTQKSTL